MMISYFEYVQLMQIIQCLRCGEIKLQKEIDEIKSTSGSSFVGSYSPTQIYAIGQTVIYLDGTYKAIKASVGQTPSTTSTYWSYVGPFEVNGGTFTSQTLEALLLKLQEDNKF